jgi:hypothetical protein
MEAIRRAVGGLGVSADAERREIVLDRLTIVGLGHVGKLGAGPANPVGGRGAVAGTEVGPGHGLVRGCEVPVVALW